MTDDPKCAKCGCVDDFMANGLCWSCLPEPGTVEREACVDAFAKVMKEKLAENAHKGDREGWRKDTPSALFARLREEVDEMETAVEDAIERAWSEERRVSDEETEAIMGEAADVGNFAMFIADLFDALGVKWRGAATRRGRALRRAAGGA